MTVLVFVLVAVGGGCALVSLACCALSSRLSREEERGE
jgi:hypothetical protein